MRACRVAASALDMQGCSQLQLRGVVCSCLQVKMQQRKAGAKRKVRMPSLDIDCTLRPPFSPEPCLLSCFLEGGHVHTQ
jgi:hypothetical protein